MDKLVIYRDAQEIRRFDFSALCSLPDQDERPHRSLGGMVVASIRLRTLVEPHAYVTFHSFDGYSTSLPWEALDHAVLAYRLDRLPLPRQLGGPFRLHLAGANPSLKYIDVIELGAQPRPDVLPICHHDTVSNHLSP